MRNAAKITFIALLVFITTGGFYTEGGFHYEVTVISWEPFYLHPQIPDVVGHRASDIYEVSMWQLYTNHTPDYAIPNSASAQTYTNRISSSARDVEERLDGTMYLDSTDLELIRDTSGEQKVGLVFDLDIPSNATITSAYIEFTVDETTSETTNLEIRYSTDISPFTDANNISARTLSTEVINWSPGAWNTVGATHNTPDIKTLIPRGESQVLIVFDGTGKRVAQSFDKNPNTAALLKVNYTIGSGEVSKGDWIPFNQHVACNPLHPGCDVPYGQSVWNESELFEVDPGVTHRDKWGDQWGSFLIFPGYIGVLPVTVKWMMKNTRTGYEWEIFRLTQSGYIDCSNAGEGVPCVGVPDPVLPLMPPNPPTMVSML